jgi:quercetin dioxygenase-like cupin family protein
VTVPDRVLQAFAAEGIDPQTWSNAAGFEYAEHTHPAHKVLFCLDGSIAFHLPGGDVAMSPGDRLDLPAGTPHAATVGPRGVTCMEGFR